MPAPIKFTFMAARKAHLAHDQGVTLKEAALQMDYLSAEEFDRLVDP